MEQTVIIYKINLFSLLQKLEVFQSTNGKGEAIETVMTKADDLTDNLFTLIEKYNIDTVYVRGQKHYKEKYIQDFKKAEMSKYARNTIKFL